MRISGLGYFVFCGSFLLLVGYIVASPQKGGYHLLKKVPLGAAEGGGEYYDYIAVDAAAPRLPHARHGSHSA